VDPAEPCILQLQKKKLVHKIMRWLASFCVIEMRVLTTPLL